MFKCEPSWPGMIRLHMCIQISSLWPNIILISVCAFTPLFFCLDPLYICKISSGVLRASHRDYSTRPSEMQYTQMPQSLLISLTLYVHIELKRRRLPGWFCCRELQWRGKWTELQRWEGRMLREVETLSPASFCCLALSEVPFVSNWVKRDK